MANSSVMPPMTPIQANELLEKLEASGLTREHLQVLVNSTPVREHVISLLNQYLPGKHRM